MQVPVYNALGKQIGYYTPDGKIYVYKSMKNDNLGYYFDTAHSKPVPGYKQPAQSSAGMPNVPSTTPKSTKSNPVNTGDQHYRDAIANSANAKAVNAANQLKNSPVNTGDQQYRNAIANSANAKNINAANQLKNSPVNTGDQQYRNAIANSANAKAINAVNEKANQLKNSPMTGNGDQQYRDAIANSDAAKVTNAYNQLQNSPMTGNGDKQYRDTIANSDAAKAINEKNAAKPIAKANNIQQAVSGTTQPQSKTTQQPVSKTESTPQNNYNLEQYDKWASDNLKKTLAKAGKLDQYQNFVNDFYGSSSMDNNRYDELMNKYGLGDTLKNNFYFGKSNFNDSYNYANKNRSKSQPQSKTAQQPNQTVSKQPKQAASSKSPNVEDVLKNASQDDMMQFMVGKGPIYDALKASGKY